METEKPLKKNFSLKIRPALKLQIFSLLFGEFSVILRFIIYKILELDRNNIYSHFCFYKILILRENKYRGFSYGHWNTKRKFQKM